MQLVATNEMAVRLYHDSDLKSIISIESQSFAEPWSLGDFKAILESPHIKIFTAIRNDRVAGYTVLDVGHGVIDLINIAVHPKYRRAKIGVELVNKVLDCLTDNISLISAVTMETNIAAQLFFSHCGFVASEVIRNAYTTNDLSAYRMVFRHGWPRNSVSGD